MLNFGLKEAPKLLLGIMACHHRAHHLDALRSTCLKGAKIDYRFFFGRGQHDVQPDEVIMDCDDAYRGLACKVQASCQWALANGYKFFFKSDDDTYIRPERLLRAGFDEHDYVGKLLGATDHYHTQEYARGGTGYWLSEKAMQALASAPTPNPDIPSEYAEDSWVGKTLKAAGIQCVNSDRLRCADQSGPNRSARQFNNNFWKKDVPTAHNDIITVCEFLGSEMLPVHDEWEKSQTSYKSLISRLTVK